MNREHGLILTSDEMIQIVRIVGDTLAADLDSTEYFGTMSRDDLLRHINLYEKKARERMQYLDNEVAYHRPAAEEMAAQIIWLQNELSKREDDPALLMEFAVELCEYDTLQDALRDLMPDVPDESE
jgi:hypothetical protein